MSNDVFTEFRPHWALRRAVGYFEVGAQLCTKDGRRIGNAFVAEIVDSESVVVFTDCGTKLTLNKDELAELFFEPNWIMDTTSHPYAHGKTKFENERLKTALREIDQMSCNEERAESIAIAFAECRGIARIALKGGH